MACDSVATTWTLTTLQSFDPGERLSARNLYEELGSYRAVTPLVGCDHWTAKAWIERERDGLSIKQRPRAIDPYPPLIRAKVGATQGTSRASGCYRVLRAGGYRATL